MPKEALPMNKIEAILQLRQEGLSYRRIAAATGVKKSTVEDYVKRAKRAGVGWPLPAGWSESELHAALFGVPAQSRRKAALPDCAYLHKELRKKGVTLQLLHDEYLADNPDGYRYSQFCEHYRQFKKTLKPSMRQHHRAGEKLFVDFAGQTIPIVDLAGQETRVQLFVATFGASNYTYAEAVATQGLEDWVAVHNNMAAYFGGLPELVVSDNLKAAVDKPCRYEPQVNRTYEDWARHNGTCILPTRSAKPQDKAKVENAVLVAERWILAALRKRTFFSLGDLNKAIRELLKDLNSRPFKKLEGCRESLFRELDAPALKPLPAKPYEFASWRKAKVNVDYHVALYLGNRRYHYYSVPYALAGQEVDLRIARSCVEVFFDGKRVASHLRSDAPGKSSTCREHMPSAHRRHAEWTPGRILNWADQIGDHCRLAAKRIMADRPHPEQGFRSCLGLVRLAKRYGAGRLDAACRRALALDLVSFQSVKNMLETNQDKLPLLDDQPLPMVVNNPTHLRGSAYYR